LVFAHDSRAVAKFSSQVALSHQGHAQRSLNVPCVDEPVKLCGNLIQFQEPFLYQVSYFWSSISTSEGGLCLNIILSASSYLWNLLFSPYRFEVSRMYAWSTSIRKLWSSRLQNQLIHPTSIYSLNSLSSDILNEECLNFFIYFSNFILLCILI
jgi:hypothetical protein